ncbi:histone-lysine N-methyltransferase [Powellomyces hirtus]|uniref:Histone-lysine N-methyltransferase n=1 Tax=Powellomyces hirtus TaxID=109895 RepID=A0A507E1Y5_9FUNG|nr:histone-lysine N-methyltransferase [Powellomyces hirtus]
MRSTHDELRAVEDISNGAEPVPIPAADSRYPEFEYVTCNLVPPEAAIPLYDGCDCVLNCVDTPDECGCEFAHGHAYGAAGRLLSTPADARGVRLPLQVFPTMEKGWAVRTMANLLNGTFVAEYAGEIIGSDEASRRWRERKEKGTGNYILCVREHAANGRTYRTNIDPTDRGNVARFINHSCDPNLVMVPVRINQIVPSAALFALRDIEAGEELTFDYSGAGEVSQVDSGDANRIRCACGSELCRGYLPYDSAL